MKRLAKLATILLAAAALALPATASVDAPEAAVTRAHDLYRAITSYHVLLGGDSASGAAVRAALYDVERYVNELDERLATSTLFLDDPNAVDAIRTITAKAHFQAALLHARGVDLEGSMEHYETVFELLGYDPEEWTEPIERSARRGLVPGASETVYQLAEPSRVIDDLETFWSAGVVTRFHVRDYPVEVRSRVSIARVGGRKDAFTSEAFEVAAERFRSRMAEGHEEFRVVLPPGTYELGAQDEAVPTRRVVLKEGGVPDPIVLSPSTFSFLIASHEGRCRPAFTLNGLPVDRYDRLPFGTYRVTPSPDCPRRMPDKITVEQKSEVTLRTEPERLDVVKEGQPIFLFITTPADSMYTLRM